MTSTLSPIATNPFQPEVIIPAVIVSILLAVYMTRVLWLAYLRKVLVIDRD